jgi:hypothetical protein
VLEEVRGADLRTRAVGERVALGVEVEQDVGAAVVADVLGVR